MPVQPTYPGVYIEEIPSGVRTITGVATSITAFIGRAPRGPKDKATTITSFADFERRFGGLSATYPMSYAVRDFFLNGGAQAIIVRLYEPVKDGDTTKPAKSLIKVGEFTLEAAYEGSWGTKLRAMLDKKVSPEVAANMGLTADQLFNLTVTDTGPGGSTEIFRNLSVAESARRIDRVLNDQSRLVRWKEPSLDDPSKLPSITEGSDEVGKAEAGVAAADQEVAAAKKEQAAAEAKSPPNQAEIDAAKQKVTTAQSKLDGAKQTLKSKENGILNPLGINCLRTFPVAGRVVWGARTLRGADQLADEYKYIPVRRLALFIEESLYRSTQWVVFEPNDEPLWAQIRLNIGAFMHNLFRQGAFQGRTPRDAYFVKCDKETTTQNDINLGIVNIVVGFAPLKPAEFVIIKIQQIAGEIQT
jgi:phage tail sheath protein FI